ncbi:MAG: flagellar hook-basal body complex protein [Bacillota bacterium]|jgi:flagellar hook protein FlgE
MIRSLYSGVIGMKNHQVMLDVVANNISNANTTAYKSSRVTFQDLLSQTILGAAESSGNAAGINPSQVGIGSLVAAIDPQFTQGPTQYTGRPLDVAIQGNGFFAVDGGEEGEQKIFFTRDGCFKFDKEGYLANNVGYRVLDSEGEVIQITDPIASFTIDRQGKLTALDENGTVIAEKNIGIAYVLNPESLLKEGYNLYTESVNTKYPDGEEDSHGIGAAGIGGRGIVEPQTLEMSNVDLTTEFANMIVAQRAYQANARAITTSDHVLEELINLKR